MTATTAYTQMLARAQADPDVLGVILSGSRARGTAGPRSDHDVAVVVRAGAAHWTGAHTAELDTAVLTLADLADVSDRWQRYAYRGAVVLVDRLGGRIAELVRAQATLSATEADTFVRAHLDGYVNFAYRAAKSRRDGHHDLARLDEIEAVSWFLWTLFALYGRVRPYNKYLRWELEHHPLPAPWTADRLIGTLTDRPSTLFTDLEQLARAHGYGDVIDGWDDLDLLR